jgi:hypothetical protein
MGWVTRTPDSLPAPEVGGGRFAFARNRVSIKMNEATTNRALEPTHMTVGRYVPSALFVSVGLRCTLGRDIPRCGTPAAPTAHDSSARGNAPWYTGLLGIACPEGAPPGLGPLHSPHRQPVGGLPCGPGRSCPFRAGRVSGTASSQGECPGLRSGAPVARRMSVRIIGFGVSRSVPMFPSTAVPSCRPRDNHASDRRGHAPQRRRPNPTARLAGLSPC